jgi:hypothetical protein
MGTGQLNALRIAFERMTDLDTAAALSEAQTFLCEGWFFLEPPRPENDGFFVPFTEFRQKSAGFWKKPSETRRTGLSVKPADLSPKPAAFRCSQFSLFLHRCVSAEFFSIFTDFCRTFQKPTGSVASDFPYSVDFSNTADGMAWHNVILVHSSLTVSACAGPSVPCPQNDKLAR